MLTKKLLKQIDSYVEENLRFKPQKKIRPRTKVKICECCKIFFDKLSSTQEKRLEKNLAAADEETFAEYLLRFMDEHGANPVEVYKRAHLNRRFLSKLRTNRKYKPHKRTLIAIAFGMNLSLDEAENLLDRAGYSFSPYDEADVIANFTFVYRSLYFFKIGLVSSKFALYNRRKDFLEVLA